MEREGRKKDERRRKISNDEESVEKERERGQWDRDMKREQERTRDNGCNKRGKRCRERMKAGMQKGKRGRKMVWEEKG